jgi:hypothetical protein
MRMGRSSLNPDSIINLALLLRECGAGTLQANIEVIKRDLPPQLGLPRPQAELLVAELIVVALTVLDRIVAAESLAIAEPVSETLH